MSAGVFQFQRIFRRERAGAHSGASAAGVDTVYPQVAALILVGQHLHHPFGGEFGNGIGAPVGAALTTDAG